MLGGGAYQEQRDVYRHTYLILFIDATPQNEFIRDEDSQL